MRSTEDANSFRIVNGRPLEAGSPMRTKSEVIQLGLSAPGHT